MITVADKEGTMGKTELRGLRLRQMTKTAVFAALICLTTMFVRIPAPIGYIHCGDAFIFLGAVAMPFPYSAIAAAIGGAFADVLSGYGIYALPTAIIKILNAACFIGIYNEASKKLMSKKAVLRGIASGVVTVLGYFITDLLLYGNASAILIESVLPNLVQAVGSLLIFIFAAAAADKSGIMKSK